MATIHVCDRCGSKCEAKSLNTLGYVDLCGACFSAFREWMGHGD